MKDCHGCRLNFYGRCVSHGKTGIIYPKFYDAVIEELGFDEESLCGQVDIYGVPCLYIQSCDDYLESFPFNMFSMTVLHPDCFTDTMDKFNQGYICEKCKSKSN